MKEQASVMIITRHQRLCDSLETLLTTSRRLKVIGRANHLAEAVAVMGETVPDVVILDSGVPAGEVEEQLGQIRRCWPAARRIVLVDDVAGQAAAQRAGVAAALIKGSPAIELLAVVEAALPAEGLA